MNDEELVQSMIDALNESAKAWEELTTSEMEAFKFVERELKMAVTEKYLRYAERLADASFLTRWYWKRKLKNLTKALKEIKEMNDYDNEERP